MRLFVAVDIEDDIKKRIKEAMSRFGKDEFDIKFVEPVNLHFTVKFLGEVDESKLPDIEKTIAECVKKFRPFRISVGKTGYFGRGNQIRVIWTDIMEGRETMISMMKEISKSLEHIRWENREPSPHATIGRVRSGRNRDMLIQKIREMEDVKFGEMDVKFVSLKASRLSKDGPVYRDVKQFPIGE